MKCNALRCDEKNKQTTKESDIGLVTIDILLGRDE